MIRTRGLCHIHLVVRDLARSLCFFQRAFGLEEQSRARPTMVFLRTPGALDLITLNEDAAEAEHAGEHGGIAHFGFKLADDVDLDAAIAEVEL